MKKLSFLFLLAGMFSSCDDGDLVYTDLNFNGNIQKCADKEIYYKLNGKEMLFAYLPGVINPSNPLPLDQVFTHTINNPNELVYRQYSGKTTADLICGTITPATPNVIEEFNVNSGGEILYKRNRKITQSTSNNNVKVDYVYTFDFKNIVLSNGKESIKYENYYFGELLESTVNLHFSFFDKFSFCDNSSLVTYDSNQAIKINSAALNFLDVVGVQTISLNQSNYIEYLYYTGETINKEIVCSEIDSENGVYLSENWVATNGILEIITTANSIPENPNVIIGYTHTLVLKNATFTQGLNSFLITEQVLGIYTN